MKLMKVLDNFIGYYLGTGVVLWLVLILSLIAIYVAMSKRYDDVEVEGCWTEGTRQYSRSDGVLRYLDMVIGLFAWPLIIPLVTYIAWKVLKYANDKLSRIQELEKDRGDS